MMFHTPTNCTAPQTVRPSAGTAGPRQLTRRCWRPPAWRTCTRRCPACRTATTQVGGVGHASGPCLALAVFELAVVGEGGAPLTTWPSEEEVPAPTNPFFPCVLHPFFAVVGERGLKLSGGEKQRVAIAR